MSKETANTSSKDDISVIDLASPKTIRQMGYWSLIVAAVLTYLLIATWPVIDLSTPMPKQFRPFNLFGFWCWVAPDRQMLCTVVFAGAIGSLTHAMTSFGDYVGNKELNTNWIWFLVLRIPTGIALALLFYFIVRGGLLLPTLQATPSLENQFHSNATVAISPYGIAGFSALAGMFSKQATDKLAAVFDVAFAMKDPVSRGNSLGASQALKITPSRLTIGKRVDLKVTGTGFEKGTTATIDGQEREFKYDSPTSGTIILKDEDVMNVRNIELIVTNPNKDRFKASIEVAQPISKTHIAASDPEQVKVGDLIVAVIGEGFKSDYKATINGIVRPTKDIQDKKLSIVLEPSDTAPPVSELSVVVGAGSDGPSSNVYKIAVK